jgi:ferritin-like metal-binding protein YciE
MPRASYLPSSLTSRTAIRAYRPTLIAAAQKVEHYEISGYGTLRALAEHLGKGDLARLLAQTLAEEEKTDELLTEISPSVLDEIRDEEDEEGQANTGSRKLSRAR